MTKVAIRNNNPGCIRGKGRSYARYANLEEGYDALIRLLQKRYHNKTASQIFKVYAPASDGNNPQKYAAGVIKQLRNAGLNVNASTKLDMNNPQVLRALCLAISRTECSQALDPTSLDRALAKNFGGMTSQSALAAQTQKQTRPSFWKRLFSRKKSAVATASPQKVISSVKAATKATANSKPYPALVKLYYNKLRSMNAIDRRKTPLRWRQAQQGTISEKNIPTIRNQFENDSIRAMAAAEKVILLNTHLPAHQQMQTIFAQAAQSMQRHILANDPRCEEMLAMITGSALVEIQQRQEKQLTPNETNKIYATAQALVSNSCLRENPSRFLAQCNKILNPAGNTSSQLNSRLAQSGASVQEDSLMWQRVVANNARG